MYCNDCGRENRADARFCKKCGVVLEPEHEVETVVAKREDAADELEEPTIFAIRPTLMFVKMGYILAVLSAFLLVALLATIGSFFTAAISRKAPRLR